MQTVLLVLTWLAMGLHLTAVYFVIRIASRKTIATFPYALLGTSLLITTFTRLDNFYHFLRFDIRTILLFIASFLAMSGFSYIYVLTKIHNEK